MPRLPTPSFLTVQSLRDELAGTFDLSDENPTLVYKPKASSTPPVAMPVPAAVGSPKVTPWRPVGTFLFAMAVAVAIAGYADAYGRRVASRRDAAAGVEIPVSNRPSEAQAPALEERRETTAVRETASVLPEKAGRDRPEPVRVEHRPAPRREGPTTPKKGHDADIAAAERLSRMAGTQLEKSLK